MSLTTRIAPTGSPPRSSGLTTSPSAFDASGCFAFHAAQPESFPSAAPCAASCAGATSGVCDGAGSGGGTATGADTGCAGASGALPPDHTFAVPSASAFSASKTSIPAEAASQVHVPTPRTVPPGSVVLPASAAFGIAGFSPAQPHQSGPDVDFFVWTPPSDFGPTTAQAADDAELNATVIGLSDPVMLPL